MSEDISRDFLGTRLREAREYAGFSQEQVAEFLGISRSAISLIEKGSRKVDTIELKRLSKLYQRSMDDLCGQGYEAESSISMVARAVADLSEHDRSEVLRFAEFLNQRARRDSDEA